MSVWFERESLLVKMIKLVNRRNSKTRSEQIHEKRKRKRQRASHSTYLSCIEPMPTITEEEEIEFTVIRF
ncbi:unnamed protein product [Cylicocyclus nassatus]|uniref:Uncharacterized protein n=1 Tax=Cylicocyclus nassatus TaxID=53992 RepID=A0AA36DP01_CYLNA|nr:unnamed protein product [Cylicocyclus nassatus]